MVAINPSIALQVENPQIPRVMNTAAQAVGVGNAMRQEDRAATAFGIEKEQIEYDTALNRSKEGLRFIRTPEEYISWSESNFKDPIIGNILTKMGVTPEKSRAQIQAEIGKPGGLERLIQQSAAGIDQLPNIMGDRSNQLIKQQETAAANARKAQQQAVLQGIISGQGGAPNALMPTGAGRTAPVNALTAPAPQATSMRPPPPGVTNVTPLEGMTVSAAPPTGSLVTPDTMQPSGAPAASRGDELKAKIIQLRNLAAANYPGASAAADQLQKTLDLISPESKTAPTASIQEYNLALQQGYQGSFQDFKAESAEVIPKDYRKTPDGGLEVIPGSPTAKKDKESASVAGATIDAAIANIDELIGPVDKIKYHKGLESATGPLDVKLPTLRDETANAEAYIQSLQAKASLEGLRTIRGQAGAIGQITEKEWPRLENLLATLQASQGTTQFVKSLNEYRKALLDVKKQINNASSGGSANANVPKTGAIVDGYRFNGGDPAVEANWQKVK